MNQENCGKTHLARKEFNDYTMNSEALIEAAINMGVDSYFTDFPGLAMELEKRNKEVRRSRITS